MRTASLYDRPGDDYQSNKGDLWTISFSSFGFSDSCIRIPEIQRVSIVLPTGNDDWNVETVVTLVSGSSNLQVITRDLGVNRWINGRMDLSSAGNNIQSLQYALLCY